MIDQFLYQWLPIFSLFKDSIRMIKAARYISRSDEVLRERMLFIHMQIQHASLYQSKPSFPGVATHLTADTAPGATFLPAMIMASVSVASLPFKENLHIYIYSQWPRTLSMQSMQQEGWEDTEGRLGSKHGMILFISFS